MPRLCLIAVNEHQSQLSGAATVRSRALNLTFLQDHNLNELLPFGEYIPPERLAANGPCVLMGLDAWELERLLQRLAVPGGARRDRRSRARAVTSHPATGQLLGVDPQHFDRTACLWAPPSQGGFSLPAASAVSCS